jgi:hypothetical protein
VQEQAWPSLGNHPQAARLYAGRGPSSMEPKRAAIHRTPCAFRQVRWSFPTTACLRCRRLAPRLWDASRVAVDIDLDQPVVLTVVVSVHVCPVCGRMFRAHPPFLRPRAIYTLSAAPPLAPMGSRCALAHRLGSTTDSVARSVSARSVRSIAIASQCDNRLQQTGYTTSTNASSEERRPFCRPTVPDTSSASASAIA